MEGLKIYEEFKDIWRNGKYTLSTEKGYYTFHNKREALKFLNLLSTLLK
jgi:hypothetical protein